MRPPTLDPVPKKGRRPSFCLTMRTLVLGLGNPLLKDDSAGLRVAQELRARLADQEGVEVDIDYWGGLRLMERLVGYDRAIIVDAICTGQAPAGTLHWLKVGDIPTQRSASSHDMNLPTALQLGRQAGAHLPENEHIALLGIETADVQTFDEQLSPVVADAIPRAVEAVLAALARDSFPL